ncbi:hypothetical protein T484DRAFT_1849868 [Baffinella frigidus]|nr:hypothetical protein T484DRAFT_1849868 [Cryptophyta sp. CCMP2293]
MLAAIHRAGFARRPREAEIGVVWREERPGAAGPQQVGSRAMLAAGRRSAESVTRGEKGGDLWRPAETAAAALGDAHEERTASDASTVRVSRCGSCETEQQRMLSRRVSLAAQIERTARDASSIDRAMRSRTVSRVKEEQKERASSDPDVARALQHLATHHHDPASSCTTSASADDAIRRAPAHRASAPTTSCGRLRPW